MKKHIVCFGDSNTHGYCAKDGGRYDETQRWTGLLQKSLGENYLILEEGLSGRTTCFQDPIHEGMSALEYITPCLMSHEPVDLLIIMLGTNDTKERFGASAACIGIGLKRLAEKAIATKECWRTEPKILLIVPQNIGKKYIDSEVGDTMGRGCAEKSELLAGEFWKAAEGLGCEFMDANEVISGGPNQYDYMHLTEEGHFQLAKAIEKYILSME